MITKRLLIAQAALLLGMGSVFVLPNNPHSQVAGVVMELPRFVAPDWVGEDVPVSELERQALAPDTGFARKQYRNARGEIIFIGIVLSGEDMANSIHRPERCLVAQGWNIQAPEARRVAVGGEGMEFTQLRHTQPWPPAAPKFVRRDITYYWFIGSRDRTASHLTRTLIDMKDRLLHGENQRWAYVTAQSPVLESFPGTRGARDDDGTAAMIEDFLPRVIPSFERQASSGNAGTATAVSLAANGGNGP